MLTEVLLVRSVTNSTAGFNVSQPAMEPLETVVEVVLVVVFFVRDINLVYYYLFSCSLVSSLFLHSLSP
jgi:hypothetical protein